MLLVIELVMDFFFIANNLKNNLSSIRIQFKLDLNPIRNPIKPNLIRL